MIEDARATIRFRIAGALRFLSHAETARVFQRAFARAGIPVRYSQGFNPHPRMSLPLPRPVGVEADEERLLVRLRDARESVASQAERETAMKRALAEQLPEGIEVRAVDLGTAGTSLQPQAAEYVFPLGADEDPDLAERLKEAAAKVMASERCLVERASAPDKAPRSVDVRPFLQSIRVENGNLVVQHGTGATGSIRVEEILQLLGLRTQDLAGPVRRTNVIWVTS